MIARAADDVPFYVHHVVDALVLRTEPITEDTPLAVVKSFLIHPQDPWDMSHFRERIDIYYQPDERALALDLLDVFAMANGPLSANEAFSRYCRPLPVLSVKLRVGCSHCCSETITFACRKTTIFFSYTIIRALVATPPRARFLSPEHLFPFTPSLMSAQTLEELLVQRQALAQRLTDLVRDSTLTASKHHVLLVGPRGMGKTHLVALIYHRIKAMLDLTDALRIAWMQEEEWGVDSFWTCCCASAVPCRLSTPTPSRQTVSRRFSRSRPPPRPRPWPSVCSRSSLAHVPC